MTDHPITPPPELYKQWEGMTRSLAFEAAYRAGADMELEACCEILRSEFNYHRLAEPLRAARRPKPPSLKELALTQVESFACSMETLGMDSDLIRRALEQLND